MSSKELETWEMWVSDVAAAGLSFARSKIDPASVVLVHSAPQTLTVNVRDGEGDLKAHGKDLKKMKDTPMARLTCAGGEVKREEIWPSEEDIGKVVILPGGEAGILMEWWNAEDHSEWRWRLEFYNHR